MIPLFRAERIISFRYSSAHRRAEPRRALPDGRPAGRPASRPGFRPLTTIEGETPCSLLCRIIPRPRSSSFARYCPSVSRPFAFSLFAVLSASLLASVGLGRFQVVARNALRNESPDEGSDDFLLQRLVRPGVAMMMIHFLLSGNRAGEEEALMSRNEDTIVRARDNDGWMLDYL